MKKSKLLFNRKYNHNFFCLIIFILIFKNIINRKLYSNSEKIIVTIEGSGCNQILNLNEINEPDKIIINNENYNSNSSCAKKEDGDSGKYKINLGNKKNIYKVELIWDDINFNKLDYLFSGISNIIEVDLSQFDTKKITSIQGLFKNCESLKSINLNGKFNTYNINNMNEIFSGCNSLKYLDLSKLDTSNTKSMKNMFQDCSSLTLLNMPNFITKKTENINNIFKGCFNLEYLNIENSDFSNINNIENIFSELTNTIICIDLNNTSFNLINKEKLKINCDKNWNEYLEEKLINIKDINYNCSIEDFFHEICNMIFLDDEERNQFIEKIIEQIQNKEMNNLLNEVIKENKILLGHENKNNNLYQLSTIENQFILENNTIIDFGNCEQEIKLYNPNQKFILFKVERFYPGYKIPIITYNVFTEDGTDELDINACKELPQLIIPVSINSNELYKYDINNNYYKDICSISTSVTNTDITFYDRYNDYNEQHLTLCEYDCNFLEYNPNTSKVLCECPQKDIYSQKLPEISVKKNTNNFFVLKCFNLISSTGNLITNPGLYIFALVFIAFIIFYLIFFIKGYKLLKKKIQDIFDKKFKKKNNNNNKLINNKNIIFNKKISDANKNKKFKDKKSNKKSLINNINNDSSKNKMIKMKNTYKTIFSKNIIKTQNNNNNYYNEFELFFLPYELGKIFDKRPFKKLYTTLIKMNQLIIFSLFYNKDNNPSILKKYLLCFSFILNYSINALFFNDEIMHQIYLDEGNYNIIFQIKNVLYSSIISSLIIKFFIKMFIMYEDYFITIKTSTSIIKAINIKKNILRNILIKNIIFFVINLLLIIFFGYYLICFNSLYINTKIYLLINTGISFTLFMILPFIFSAIQAFIRKDSLTVSRLKKIKTKNKKQKENNKNKKLSKKDTHEKFYMTGDDKDDREFTYNLSQLLLWL